MVKITEDMAKMLVYALVPLLREETNVYTMADIAVDGTREWTTDGHSDAHKAARLVAFENPPHTYVGVEDLIMALTTQLKRPQTVEEDEDGNVIGGNEEPVDLLELMAEALLNPLARNSLSGSTLAQLRKAILLPEEASRLKDLINKVNSCTCGTEFMPGEMVTTSASVQGPTLTCVKCGRPRYARCAELGCNELVAVEPPVVRCRTHQRREARGARGITLNDLANALPTFTVRGDE